MKEDLLKLIDRINEIKIEFSVYPNVKESSKFTTWKEELICELNEIYKHTKKESNVGVEFEALTLLKNHFDGYHDTQDFASLIGKLNHIKNNIDKFYPEEKDDRFSFELDLSLSKENTNSKKNSNLKSKIFISHSCLDVCYTDAFVELLEDIGLKEYIIYTSIHEYGVPMNADIHDYLRKQFQTYNLHVFFMLSDNFYKSAICLGETGATWVTQNKYTIITLPGFECENIKGLIKREHLGLILDEKSTNIMGKLRNIKNDLIQEFNLPTVPEEFWTRKCEKFIKEIDKSKNISSNKS